LAVKSDADNFKYYLNDFEVGAPTVSSAAAAESQEQQAFHGLQKDKRGVQ
jgi:hypothetical protein